MTVEERLTQALQEAADDVEVDLQRTYAQTQAKLGSRQSSPSRSRTPPALLVAAAVAVITIGSATLSQGWSGWSQLSQLVTQDTGRSIEGGVDDTFRCDAQTTVVFSGSLGDDSFLPVLEAGPAAAAEDVDAPRYEYVEDGDEAELRMGNADGSLANVSTFRRAGSGWELVEATKCTGIDGGVLAERSAAARLGAHGVIPWPAEGMLDARFNDGDPVLLDDRPFYDTTGLMTHRSIYAAPCDDGLCLTAGEPTSMLISSIRSRADFQPVDVSSMFLPPDEMVGKINPYGLWALYDPDSKVDGLTVTLEDGSTKTARMFSGDNWNGHVFAVLATFRDVSAVTVHRADKKSIRYEPQELPGYEPRTPGS